MIAQITKIGTAKEDELKTANKTRIECVKNQVAPPFRRGEFEIRYGIGIDRTASLLDAALEHGIIEKSGAWMSFDGERIGQGRANVLEFLNEHEDIKASIELDYKTAVAEAKEADEST